MVDTLETLHSVFTITNINNRIDPTARGNKTILVNLVVEAPAIRPRKYEWSGWWDSQVVCMIAEVKF